HRYHGAQQLFSEPSARCIVEELANTCHEECGGVLSVVRAGERPIAMQLGINGPTALCWWFTAFDDDVARFSPGKVMSFALAEEAAHRGIARIDLGPGQEGYKFQLANDSYPVAGGAVWAWRPEASARAIFRQLIYERRRR